METFQARLYKTANLRALHSMGAFASSGVLQTNCQTGSMLVGPVTIHWDPDNVWDYIPQRSLCQVTGRRMSDSPPSSSDLWSNKMTSNQASISFEL